MGGIFMARLGVQLGPNGWPQRWASNEEIQVRCIRGSDGGYLLVLVVTTLMILIVGILYPFMVYKLLPIFVFVTRDYSSQKHSLLWVIFPLFFPYVCTHTWTHTYDILYHFISHYIFPLYIPIIYLILFPSNISNCSFPWYMIYPIIHSHSHYIFRYNTSHCIFPLLAYTAYPIIYFIVMFPITYSHCASHSTFPFYISQNRRFVYRGIPQTMG